MSPRKTLCLHSVRLENGQQMETLLHNFLSHWKKAVTEGVTQKVSGVPPQILALRLKIAPHNSWKDMEQSVSSIDFVVDQRGLFKGASMPKIVDYLLCHVMNLVFKLVYRIRYEIVEGKPEEKDFTIAYGLFSPTVSSGGDDIREESVRFELMTGPGTTLFGEPLWDPQNEQVKLMLSFLINTSEDNISDVQREEMMAKSLAEQERKRQLQMEQQKTED